MRTWNRIGTLFILGLMSLVLAKPSTAQEAANPAKSSLVFDGFTKPSEERALSFMNSGLVRNVLVKEGEHVKQGQELLAQDDRMEQKTLESLRIEADSGAKLDYSKTELAQKKVKLGRIQKLRSQDAASPSELEEAQLDVVLAETRVKLAEDELAEKKLEAQKQQIKVELMHLASTIDGVVQRLNLKAGELADPNNSANKPPVVVVQNDPLKVEVRLPTNLAARLRSGEELEVRYPETQAWQKAKIIFFDPVADAGSNTRLLHLEMPNPDQKESGWQVQVRVPPGTLAEAGK